MQVRVMTYNIKSGRYHPEGLEAVARIIETHSPDILALQEVDEGMRRTQGIAQTDWLTRRLRLRGLFAPAMEYDQGLYGIALLARWPILAHERRLHYRPNYSDAGSRPRHDSEQRVMLGATIALPGAHAGEDGAASLKVILTHLGLTSDQRVLQVRALVDFAQSWQGDLPAIIMGDFNCDPDAPELAPLHAHFHEACADRGVQGDARYTFPSGPAGARTRDGWRGAIDYVWASQRVTTTAAQVYPDTTGASDHQPLIIDIAV